METKHSHLLDRPEWAEIPHHMRNTAELYLLHGVRPGSFLEAVLENDLAGAVGRADHYNRGALAAWVDWCFWCLPSRAWGSREAVAKWRGLEGSTDE
jgi:hypothetical protein